jgi:hypothetical protein
MNPHRDPSERLLDRTPLFRCGGKGGCLGFASFPKTKVLGTIPALRPKLTTVVVYRLSQA